MNKFVALIQELSNDVRLSNETELFFCESHELALSWAAARMKEYEVLEETDVLGTGYDRFGNTILDICVVPLGMWADGKHSATVVSQDEYDYVDHNEIEETV